MRVLRAADPERACVCARGWAWARGVLMGTEREYVWPEGMPYPDPEPEHIWDRASIELECGGGIMTVACSVGGS